MVAAEPIKTPLGQILALPGTPLTRQLINKMKLYKVGSISIQNPFDAAAPQAGENTAKRDKVKPVPKTRAHEMVTNIQRVQASEEFLGFQLKYLTCINQIKDTFGKICAGEKSFDEAALLTAVIDLSSSCGTTIETFDMLYNMRTIADPFVLTLSECRAYYKDDRTMASYGKDRCEYAYYRRSTSRYR